MRRLLSGMLSLIMAFGCLSGIAIPAVATENDYNEAESVNSANATEPACVDTECTEAETGEEILAAEAIADNMEPAVAVKAATKAVPAGLKYSVSNGEVTITDYTGSATELVIPDTINGYPVTSIGDSAFFNCDSLTSVTIGDSVTSIGSSAFYICDSLTAVYITDLAAWCGISFGNTSANPLCYAKKLYLNGELVTDLVIPDSVNTIGNYAFSDCSSLTSITIPDSVTSIGNFAFYSCISLTSVTIPDSVTSIGDSAFYYCTSLTNITIPDSVTSIGGVRSNIAAA